MEASSAAARAIEKRITVAVKGALTASATTQKVVIVGKEVLGVGSVAIGSVLAGGGGDTRIGIALVCLGVVIVGLGTLLELRFVRSDPDLATASLEMSAHARHLEQQLQDVRGSAERREIDLARARARVHRRTLVTSVMQSFNQSAVAYMARGEKDFSNLVQDCDDLIDVLDRNRMQIFALKAEDAYGLTIYLLSEAEELSLVACRRSPRANESQAMRIISAKEGIAAHVLRTGREYRAPDTAKDTVFHDPDGKASTRHRSIAVFPIRVDRGGRLDVVGVVVASASREKRFQTAVSIDPLRALVSQVEIRLQANQTQEIRSGEP